MATRIFNEQIIPNKGKDDIGQLMYEVWSPTPWIIDTYTGGYHEEFDREMQIKEWCIKNLGDESYPIHNKVGVWARGGVTIHGYGWMGFATEEMMNQFVEAWPNPEPDK